MCGLVSGSSSIRSFSMKFIVLIFISFVGRHSVLSQFQLPTFDFQSSVNAAASGAEDFVQNSPPQPTVADAPSLFTNSSNPIATFAQDFANISSHQNLIFPPGARQLNSTADYDSVPQSLRKALQSAFEQFAKAVNASLVQGLSRIQNSSQRLNETALSTIAAVENIATTGIEDIERRIQQYNETVRDCIRDNATQYQAIISAARDEAVACVSNKSSSAIEIIEKGRNDIVGAISGAQNLSATIENCSSQNYNFGVFSCFLSAIFNIQSQTVLLPIQMVKRVAEMEQFAVATAVDVGKCESFMSATFAEQSLNVTRTIAQCLVNT